LLQRRLRLGYTRAARIVDILEQRGILGPAKAPNHARFWSISMLPFSRISRHDDRRARKKISGSEAGEKSYARRSSADDKNSSDPAREIEADDFSQFPSLAYAKGFLSSMENFWTSMSLHILTRSKIRSA